MPVGSTNNAHEPNTFFGVFRPEGDATIIPCTWHETGINLWGQAGDWKYQLLLISALDSYRFGRDKWVGASGSPY